MKAKDPLPMAMQPAIAPHIGRLLDIIGSKTNADYEEAWKAYGALVPRKIQAAVHVVRAADDENRPIDCCIWVFDGWPSLWCGGAFGKGILSRSDPTWVQRYTRDASSGCSTSTMYLEDITRKRRQERQQTDDTGASGTVSAKDLEVMPDELSQMEPFQLSPYEALFLSELGCLEALDSNSGQRYTHGDLWRTLHAASANEPASDFVLKYAAYYYYRAKGWVVRSGIKFGTDFLLYKSGGPSKSHSQYSVIVRERHPGPKGHRDANVPLAESWQFMFALSRVTAQAQKSLLVCYIDAPANNSARDMHEHVKADAEPDLRLFGVQEVVVQRFNPNKK
ncbi:tRNA splicing endonuclease subunit sen2 [Coemansia sp. RSA 487]|nr:tRNA splicing endonuclease subunit sen2 [Coemansia sp. RSA 487]